MFVFMHRVITANMRLFILYWCSMYTLLLLLHRAISAEEQGRAVLVKRARDGLLIHSSVLFIQYQRECG